ncbi:MAG: glycoside hydrolase family 71/99-like protein [Kiritimatiellae bacterium]|nr:glycoside hydrolase family 71/99-like protein [Kiritimatiellia bacterium]MDD5520347.1 glycoside hydrolase family 71/99-like protein [Kiritimatiellia bacterium]
MLSAEDFHDPIDASTLRGKVLCGYQGWFRCFDDGENAGWVHWSRDSRQITPETLTFDMWPDMTEYSQEERYPVPGFTNPDGNPATLFSSANQRTVLRHFEWMKQYGIHGVWLQHFVVDLPGAPIEKRHTSRMKVLQNVRDAAQKTGRIWALAFDMAGMPSEQIFDLMTAEWKRLVDTGITNDTRYLHHNGKPVLMVWGFYNGQNITPGIANRIIDFFKNDPKYSVFLVGGCEWWWRTEKDQAWAKLFRRFDVISPWNVGNCSVDVKGTKWAPTDYWKEDMEEARRAGMLYLPVIYPGFSWDNLKKLPPGQSNISRQGGRFMWKQFYAAAELGADMAYVAMFDEVDEGTAIFKVCNTPPTQAQFVTYEGLKSDWYLWLTGEGTRMILGKQGKYSDMPTRQ